MSTFPATRLRRLRRTSRLRSLVRETRLDLGDFLMPLFVCSGEGVVHPLEGLPGIGQRSVDALVDETETLVALPLLAAFRAIWEFFSGRIELERWDEAAGEPLPVPVDVEPPEPPTEIKPPRAAQQ